MFAICRQPSVIPVQQDLQPLECISINAVLLYVQMNECQVVVPTG